jgi:hypothetical protein
MSRRQVHAGLRFLGERPESSGPSPSCSLAAARSGIVPLVACAFAHRVQTCPPLMHLAPRDTRAVTFQDQGKRVANRMILFYVCASCQHSEWSRTCGSRQTKEEREGEGGGKRKARARTKCRKSGGSKGSGERHFCAGGRFRRAENAHARRRLRGQRAFACGHTGGRETRSEGARRAWSPRFKQAHVTQQFGQAFPALQLRAQRQSCLASCCGTTTFARAAIC